MYKNFLITPVFANAFVVVGYVSAGVSFYQTHENN